MKKIKLSIFVIFLFCFFINIDISNAISKNSSSLLSDYESEKNINTILNINNSSFFGSEMKILANGITDKEIKADKITCRSIFGEEGNRNKLYDALQNIFKLMEFSAPVLLIVLSSMDYIMAIASHDADDLKKANGKFVKRLVIGILIFLLPFLLDFVFETFGIYNLETCGIGK